MMPATMASPRPAPGGAGAGGVSAVEAFEDLLSLSGWDAGSVVGDAELDVGIGLGDCEGDLGVLGTVFLGVFDEVCAHA